MTRNAARQQGLKRYMPEKPCVHGHFVERYVGNNYCVECSAQRALAYGQANKEAARLKSQKWRAENPEQHRQNARNAFERDPQKYRDNAKQWSKDNPERVKENARRTYQDNPERAKKQAREWAIANPGKVRATQACNHRRRKMARIPLSPENKTWLAKIYGDCPPGFEVDHVYPVNGTNSCGLHVPWNLQYLTPAANRSKSNKLPDNDNTAFRKAA